jgi:hypothetical protein
MQFQQALASEQLAKEQIASWNTRLTDSQRAQEEASSFVRKFLAYVIKENNLPDTAYDLSPDSTELIGTVPDPIPSEDTIETKTEQTKE